MGGLKPAWWEGWSDLRTAPQSGSPAFVLVLRQEPEQQWVSASRGEQGCVFHQQCPFKPASSDGGSIQWIHIQHWSFILKASGGHSKYILCYGIVFAQAWVKVVCWQLGAHRPRGISFLTVNLFVQSIWGYCKGRQWKIHNLYMLHIKETR